MKEPEQKQSESWTEIQNEKTPRLPQKRIDERE